MTRLFFKFVLAAFAMALGLCYVNGTEPAARQKFQGLLSEASVALLKEGNTRFVSDAPRHPNADSARRAATAAEGQEPFVTVLSCSDSRAPVELIFDRGVGEVFTVRVAGNVADTDEIATIEYAVGHLHTPLLVVLGHTRCGAVTAVVKGAELHGSLPELVDNIKPAAERARAATQDEKEIIPTAIRENVWQSINDILRRSEIIRGELAKGSVSVVGGVYDLDTGKVGWLGEHPAQKQILASTLTVNEHRTAGHEPTAPAPEPAKSKPADAQSPAHAAATAPQIHAQATADAHTAHGH
jgi:carbonic anhydrase